jgi:hypothetical protein
MKASPALGGPFFICFNCPHQRSSSSFSYESPSWNMERLVMFPSVKTHKPNFYGYFFHVFFFLKEGIEKA